MLQQLLTIGRNTFLESIRQPIVSVLVVLIAVPLLVALPHVPFYTMDDDNRLMVEVGLGTLMLLGVLLAALIATAVVTNELDNQTVLTVVSKPVSRPAFIVGKFLGVAAALALAFWILSVLLLLAIRQGSFQTAAHRTDGPVLLAVLLAVFLSLLLSAAGNYLYRWVFSSALLLSLAGALGVALLAVLLVGKQWQGQSLWAEFAHGKPLEGGQPIIALLMVFQAVLLLASLAVAAATRLSQVMTLVLCAGYYVAIGLVQGWLLAPNKGHNLLAGTLYHLLPHLEYFWPGDALSQGHPITVGHLALMATYTLLHVTAMLGLAVALFQTREVGGAAA